MIFYFLKGDELSQRNVTPAADKCSCIMVDFLFWEGEE